MSERPRANRSLLASPDGQWLITRDGRRLTLRGPRVRIAEESPPPSEHHIELDSDQLELTCTIGPPLAVVAVERTPGATRVALYPVPPDGSPTRVELPRTLYLEATGEGRVMLVNADRKELTLLRVLSRSLGPHSLPLGEGTIDFAAAVERNQMVVAQPRRVDLWDVGAVRPLRRMNIEVPAAPRLVGGAAGHLWIVHQGGRELALYRLSDGRPFRHDIGSPIEAVVSNVASPVLVLVTKRGLLRINCFAHSLFAIKSPWQPGELLAQIVYDEDVRLVGWGGGDDAPWELPIGDRAMGSSVTAIPQHTAEQPKPGLKLAIGAEEPTRFVAPPDPEPERAPEPAPASASEPAPAAAPEPAPAPIATVPIAVGPAPVAIAAPPAHAPTPIAAAPAAELAWRDALATFATDLLAGAGSAPPELPHATELAILSSRLELGDAARRALAILYGAYLVGQPALAIATLARHLGEWAEPLGRGQLAAAAMLDRARGTVALAPAVTDALDGAAPRAIRIVGGPPAPPRAGAWRVGRDGRSDVQIEATLAETLQRIAVVHGDLPRALLEARLHGATAVSFATPGERPWPWPAGAGLVLVLHGSGASWIADLPALASAGEAQR